jgi:hypothetical protein
MSLDDDAPPKLAARPLPLPDWMSTAPIRMKLTRMRRTRRTVYIDPAMSKDGLSTEA